MSEGGRGAGGEGNKLPIPAVIPCRHCSRSVRRVSSFRDTIAPDLVKIPYSESIKDCCLKTFDLKVNAMRIVKFLIGLFGIAVSVMTGILMVKMPLAGMHYQDFREPRNVVIALGSLALAILVGVGGSLLACHHGFRRDR